MHDSQSQTRTQRVLAVVQRSESVTPHMRRITLGGAALADFLCLEGLRAPAAWVKVFLPSGEGRAYTVRSLDVAAGTLTLDFVQHGAGQHGGPAAAWAAAAVVGEYISLAGPRSGGFALPGDCQWLLLAGDATALPALQSIASQLPVTIKAKAYIEVASQADYQPLPSTANLRVQWLDAQAEPGLSLCQALLHRPLPVGAGYIWMAGESSAIKRLKLHYRQERHMDSERISAKGYWKAGECDHREA
ncbi:siderophore-interacting protein [Lampropedia aestuarii]|uniref:siderophore-interacting protein n=1 Tax=Lampropedia aestuarii TaxID=2562762 RepID=UPI0024685F7E|nr:siderophore-interacting protein [Lampropedia aestuarii]MDH5856159.1 siderophore-interacting protein [Lampropedia aestuarii]